VLYLGLPVITGSSPGNTAFLSATDLTATASQTVFASAGSYTPGFVQVYRNGARLGNADFTATNGTTITLASAATAGDLVTIEYYTLTSLTNALPLTGGTVTGSTTFNSAVTINGAAVSGFTGMKNRIINGNMVVDQRNAGSAVTINTAAYTYGLDRWSGFGQATDGVFTIQRSTVAPAGFINSLLTTVTTADASIGASQYYLLRHAIEGFNAADLGWGAAGAATVTLSFWVRSSLTGSFSGSLTNSAYNRAYPFSFTINAANTFEQKTVTIAGDTSGTWLTDSGIGISVYFDLGSGSSNKGTANAWNAGGLTGVTGSVNLIATNGATFYITGVQLERGSNATSFEFIDYGRQLIQCQRYLYAIRGSLSLSNQASVGVGCWDGTSGAIIFVPFPVQLRVYPSSITVSSASDFQCVREAVAWENATAITLTADGAGVQAASITVSTATRDTRGFVARMRSNASGAYLGFNAEL